MEKLIAGFLKEAQEQADKPKKKKNLGGHIALPIIGGVAGFRRGGNLGAAIGAGAGKLSAMGLEKLQDKYQAHKAKKEKA